jgi:hypothetical protein
MITTGYQVEVVFGQADVTPNDLVHWNRARVRDRARGLVTRGFQSKRNLTFGQILIPELQDCVDRAAEQFSPEASLPLELFWTANRGVYTYYSALSLGARNSQGYLTFGSVGALGEALALFVLEDRTVAPDLFSLELMYRPLNDSPDMLMYYAADAERLALVEAKATLGDDVSRQLVEATITLIEVFKGWQQHRPLSQTDAFAVATELHEEGTFRTHVLKLIWAGAAGGI